MLNNEQLEKLICGLNGLVDEQGRFDSYIKFFRFSFQLLDEMRDPPDEVKKFLSRSQKNYLRYCWNQLSETANTVSYLQSFIDKEGHWLITEPHRDGDEEDEDWGQTSNASIRLANAMHCLGHTPEQAVETLIEVLFLEQYRASEAVSYSNYANDSSKDELRLRLRKHIYGEDSPA